jgi:hypothetical protein
MTPEELKNSQAAMREQRAPKTPKTPKKRVYKSRTQGAELKDIRRRIQRLISELEGAKDVPSKRLYFEVLNCERDRLLGKPHTALPPAKPSTPGNSKLQADIQKLFSGGERSDEFKPWGARLKQRVRGAQSSSEGAVENAVESDEDQAAQ